MLSLKSPSRVLSRALVFVAAFSSASLLASPCLKPGANAESLPSTRKISRCYFDEVEAKFKSLPLHERTQAILGYANENLDRMKIEIVESLAGATLAGAYGEAFSEEDLQFEPKTGRLLKLDLSQPVIQVHAHLIETFYSLSESLAISLRDGDWTGSRSQLRAAAAGSSQIAELRRLDLKQAYEEALERRNAHYRDPRISEDQKIAAERQYDEDLRRITQSSKLIPHDPRLKHFDHEEVRRILEDAETLFKDAMSSVLAHELGHLIIIPHTRLNPERTHYRKEWIKPSKTLFRNDEIATDQFAYQFLRYGVTRERQMIGMPITFIFLGAYSPLSRERPGPFSSGEAHPAQETRINLSLALAAYFGDYAAGEFEQRGTLYERMHFLAPFSAKMERASRGNPQRWLTERGIPRIIDPRVLR